MLTTLLAMLKTKEKVYESVIFSIKEKSVHWLERETQEKKESKKKIVLNFHKNEVEAERHKSFLFWLRGVS